MQLMISHYNENYFYFNNEQNIGETFKDFPNYFKIHEEIKTLFLNNQFQIKHIISVYEYFELLSFNEFKKNIDPRYNSNEDISKEKKEKIEKYFNNNPDAFLNKLAIATAVRRFISRNLIGIREDSEINCENELFDLLQYKTDCFDQEFTYNETLFDNSIGELKQFEIKVKEGLKLYEFLGGDDVLLGNIIKNQIMEEEEKEKEKNNTNSRKKKGKKQRKVKDTF